MSDVQVTIQFKIPTQWYYDFVDEYVEELESKGKIFQSGNMDSATFADIIENSMMIPQLLNSTNNAMDLCFDDICVKNARIIVKYWRRFVRQKIQKCLNKITFK